MSTISGPNWPYDYKAEKERRMSKPLTLPDDIRQVAADMERLVNRMIHEGVLDETQTGKLLRQHALELLGAVGIAKEWADELESEKGDGLHERK